MARIFPMAVSAPQQRSYTSNASWTAPPGVTLITRATGKGGAGTPAKAGYTDPPTTTYTLSRYSQRFYANGSTGPIELDWTRDSSAEEVKPADYCISDLAGGQICYTYIKESTTVPGTYHPPQPATTGPSATGFNKTFPGGTGGEATPVSFDNIAVVPGQAYPLVIPAGGSITINWME